MNKVSSQRPVAVVVVAVLVGSILLGGAPAGAALSLYDDFNDPSLLVRTDLWRSFDSYSTGGLGSGRPETIRAIDALLGSSLPGLGGNPSNPKLLIAKRFVLQPGAPSGSADSDGVIALQAPNATGIQADVTMKICFLSTAGFVQAAVLFAGFNDGASPAAGNRLGDIFVRLRLSCSSTTNQVQITWNVFRCTDSTCTNATSLGSGSFGPASIGQEYTLRAAKSGSSFVFTAAGQTQTFPVPGNPTAPPRSPFVELESRIDPTTPGNGGQWAVVATFDNVMIDQ